MGDPETTSRAVQAALRGEIRELPPAPAAAIRLLQLTRDENANVSTLSRAIETEPAFAAKILRIVNSAFYGFPRNIPSISQAVTLLGFSSLRREALHVLMYDGMVQRGGNRTFDRLFFWQHSLLVAILSRGMANRLGHPDPDAVYAAGLLHDLGKIVLESHGRVSYSEFLDATNRSGNAIKGDERAFFGVTHDDVGAYVCEAWELPKSVCRVQSLHHREFSRDEMTPQEAQEVAIVGLSDFIAWTQGVGSVARIGGSPYLQPVVSEIIDPAGIDLPVLLDQADAEIRGIGTFYSLSFPSSLQLRANLLATAIALSGVGTAREVPAGSYPAHLTAPHHSLDPKEFIPRTLEAMQRELGLKRLLFMQVEPTSRSLVASHSWPADIQLRGSNRLELAIPALSGELVVCLRERRPVLLGPAPGNRQLLDALGEGRAAAVPVLGNGRLQGLLLVCDGGDGERLKNRLLDGMQQVAGELGIALARCRDFAMEREKAEYDALTRLHNRYAVDRFLAESFRDQGESRGRLAVGLVDIDHFKKFNDNFGHQAGDDVLRIVADTMRGAIRPGDFLGRYGGEEFLFALKDVDAQGASICAERIRREIEGRGRILSNRFPGHALTASIGIALCADTHGTSADLVEAADRALYRAKEQGRNQVVSAWSLQDAQERLARPA